jgi:hypothetical protein
MLKSYAPQNIPTMYCIHNESGAASIACEI